MSKKYYSISVNIIILFLSTSQLLFAQIYSNNITLMGQWTDGPCNIIATTGDTAYFNNGANLEIVDFSSPNNPVQLGKLSLPTTPRSIQIQGDSVYLYSDRYNGLNIINIADPTNPTLVGSYINLYGLDSFGITVTGNYAFERTALSVQITDITDLVSPNVISVIEIPANGIVINGDYAFLIAHSHGFWIYNISDPFNPQEVTSYTVHEYMNSLYINKNQAYVGLYDTLVVLDISDIDSLKEVGKFYFKGFTGIRFIKENYAYYSNYEDFYSIDISDSSNFFLADSFTIPGNPRSVRFNDDLLYAARKSQGLTIYDMSNPDSIIQAGEYKTAGWPVDVKVVDNYIYTLEQDRQSISSSHSEPYIFSLSGLRIFDNSDPEEPVALGFYGFEGMATKMSINENLVYVADSDSGMRIFDVSNPEMPVQISLYDSVGGITDVTINGDFAYLSPLSNEFHILDISNPFSPIKVGYKYFGTAYKGVEIGSSIIDDGLAYLASGPSGLIILNISQLDSIYEVGRTHFYEGKALTLDKQDNYIYLAGLGGDVRIIDVSDSTTPIERSAFNIGFYPYDIQVIGDFAYGVSGGLHVFNISDPESQEEVGFFYKQRHNSSSKGMDIIGDLIYVADALNGLLILQNNIPVGIPKTIPKIPSFFNLEQNYPNPFNPSTTIEFDLPKTSEVILKIFNILGEEVATLVSDKLSAGSYSYEWDASNLASSVYLYRLEAGDFIETKKMILMR